MIQSIQLCVLHSKVRDGDVSIFDEYTDVELAKFHQVDDRHYNAITVAIIYDQSVILDRLLAIDDNGTIVYPQVVDTIFHFNNSVILAVCETKNIRAMRKLLTDEQGIFRYPIMLCGTAGAIDPLIEKLRAFVADGNETFSNLLLQLPNVFMVAETNHFEFAAQVDNFADSYCERIASDMSKFTEKSPADAVFELSPDQSRMCDIILNNLIRRNRVKPIQMLLDIPNVQSIILELLFRRQLLLTSAEFSYDPGILQSYIDSRLNAIESVAPFLKNGNYFGIPLADYAKMLAGRCVEPKKYLDCDASQLGRVDNSTTTPYAPRFMRSVQKSQDISGSCGQAAGSRDCSVNCQQPLRLYQRRVSFFEYEFTGAALPDRIFRSFSLSVRGHSKQPGEELSKLTQDQRPTA